MTTIPDDGEAPDVRFGARAALAAATLVLVAVPFGLLLFLVRDKWPPLLRADDSARDGLHGFALSHAGFVTAMKTLSFIGSAPVMLTLFALLAAWVAWRRLPRLAAFVVVTMGLSPLLNAAVKLTVDRARPVLADPVARAAGTSFPSGHSQNAVVASAVLLLVFMPALHGAWRRLAVAAAVVMVLAIGFSRVALGVHYVSDVLAGFALGGAWIAAMAAAFATWRQEHGHRRAELAHGLEPRQGERLGPGAPLSRSGPGARSARRRT